MTGKVLVVDPDEPAAAALLVALPRAGYEVAYSSGDEDVVARVVAARPEVIVLDLRLATLGGLEVLRRLRADPVTEAIPVVMVAQGAEEVDRVAAFMLGADDFVSKPYSAREMVLRCQAILRRVHRTLAVHQEPALVVGSVWVDRSGHRVRVEGKEVRLTHMEFRLLVTLLTRLDRVQSREMLLTDVWGMRSDVSTRTVDTHIRRLRQKLGVAAPHVETVRGVGYRFVSRLA